MNKIIILIIILVLSTACSNTKKTNNKVNSLKTEELNTKLSYEPYFIDTIYDPFESFNRRMYTFNYYADKYFMLPITKTYDKVVPGFAKKGVKNFFSNIGEIPTFFNSILQFKLKKAAITCSRFLINTTIGIGGLFDPGSKLGLVQQDEDLGQTLGFYGVPKGPYLVLPLLGPTHLRSIASTVSSPIITSSTLPEEINTELGKLPVKLVEYIDLRNNIPFEYYQTASAFEYEYIKFIYSTYTDLKTEK